MVVTSCQYCLSLRPTDLFTCQILYIINDILITDVEVALREKIIRVTLLQCFENISFHLSALSCEKKLAKKTLLQARNKNVISMLLKINDAQVRSSTANFISIQTLTMRHL